MVINGCVQKVRNMTLQPSIISDKGHCQARWFLLTTARLLLRGDEREEGGRRLDVREVLVGLALLDLRTRHRDI